MKQMTTIEMQRDSMHFAAGHFTIFSATEREPLHGHNYTVGLSITAAVGELGLSFDYRIYIHKIRELCSQLRQRFLMPTQSPYLTYTEDDEYYYFYFNQKKIPFLKEDVVLMPIRNITLEELSTWFVAQLVADKDALREYEIEKIVIKIFSAPGQSASACWEICSSNI